jgi:hypothetical protein
MSAFDTQVGGDHYKDLAIQPAEYCQRNKLGALESFVVKYVTRHPEKGKRKDIEKAIHCLQLLLEIDYPGGEGRRDTDAQWAEAEAIVEATPTATLTPVFSNSLVGESHTYKCMCGQYHPLGTRCHLVPTGSIP